MLSEISLVRDYWKTWITRAVSYICEAHFQVYNTHTCTVYKCAGEHAECSQRQGEGRGLRVLLRVKTWTVDETDGPWADQQALCHINIKPSPCPTLLHLHTDKQTHAHTVWEVFFPPLPPDCCAWRGRDNFTSHSRAEWNPDESQAAINSFHSPGRCAWHQSAEYSRRQERNIHHIAWKTISLCAGWSTLYHSNSGQGNRGMMREKRN